ncbi:hypothetical protein MMC15_000330 [Xylographa vitiligo]|nr:hypothetical protein [Xylographa vitiligo]
MSKSETSGSACSSRGGKPKNILITGGAQGIGRCTARHLLSQGHNVFLLDFNEPELTYTTKTHLAAYAPRISSAVCNLRSPASIKDGVSAAASFFSNRIDVLINNGGIARAYFTGGKTMEDPDTLSEWTAYLETNLTAPFLVSQAVIPYMKRPAPSPFDEPGGCIIHISSFRAHQSDPNCEGYASTKAGLLGLTHAMAVSAQQWGIRVNMVSPGWISVRHENREGDEKGLKWEDSHGDEDHAQHLAGRVGRGEDIAEAVEYLMNAGFMSGQEVVVDGGASKRKNPKV